MHNLLLSFFNAAKYCIERGCILIIFATLRGIYRFNVDFQHYFSYFTIHSNGMMNTIKINILKFQKVWK